MKNNITALMAIAVMASSMLMPSCNVKGTVSVGTSDSDSDTVTTSDTLWNDSVQTVFFDTPLGSSAQQVIDNFREHGFVLLDEFSDDDELIFGHTGDEYYTFGGMKWMNLTVDLKDGKFYNISFYTPRKTKEEAIADFNNIIAKVGEKYKLTDAEPADSSMYMVKRAYCKSHYVAGVGCYSYTDENNDTFYTTSLDYTDTDIQNQPAADL